MKSILGICDQDMEYADLLSENLGKRDSFPFEISTFENTDSASKSVNSGLITVLLISETMFLKCKEKLKRTGNIIILSEGNMDSSDLVNEDGKELKVIWKYQSSQNIKKEILRIISDDMKMEAKSHLGKKNTEIIGIYSFTRVREVSSYGLILGSLLSKKHKVLYISFKGMSYSRNLLDIKENKDITDLIYFQRNAGDRFLYSFEGLVSTIKKLDYITPAYSFADVKSVPAGDWLDVLNQIRNCCDYDFVILELSEMIDGFMEVINYCDNSVMLCDGKDLSGRVLKEFDELSDLLDYSQLKERRYTSVIPDNVKLPESSDDFIKGSFAEYVAGDYENIFN